MYAPASHERAKLIASMGLTLDEIGQISRAAAIEHGRAVDFAGLTSAETGTNRRR